MLNFGSLGSSVSQDTQANSAQDAIVLPFMGKDGKGFKDSLNCLYAIIFCDNRLNLLIKLPHQTLAIHGNEVDVGLRFAMVVAT